MTRIQKILREIKKRWQKDSVSEVTCADGDVYMTLLNAEKSAAFIAHSRIDIPKLVKALEFATLELKRCRLHQADVALEQIKKILEGEL